MKCDICGSTGTRIQVLTGPGKLPAIKILCVKHKKDFKLYKKKLGK